MKFFTEKQLISAMLAFLALLFPLALPAAEQYNKDFSFELRDVTLKDVFHYIENNSEYVFLYPSDKNLSKKVSINVRNKKVNEILDEVLEHTGLVYEIDGKQIIVKEHKRIVTPKPQTMQQQKKMKTISGVISDEATKESIIGATIMVKGSTAGTTSDVNGNFILECSEADTLFISYIGYKDQILLVQSSNIYSIALKETSEQLGEVVITAFGVRQKKESLVGSIQQVRPDDLKVPSSSLTSSFAGRMAGVIAVQRSGQPGADDADFWIRGKSTFSGSTGALIVLDGVEISASELNALDPEVIEGFSILKDATATAMYGTRGANGVMIVTTKSGEDLLKPIINFRMEGSVAQMTKIPEMVGGVDYMKLYNEALTTRGITNGVYSTEKIQGTEQGLNPLAFPNVNWFDEIFNRASFSQRFNFNIRGGKKAVTYFMSAAIKHDAGNLKPLSKDYYSYNNNINVTRYDFVNNLDIKATSTTKVSLGLNVSLRDWKGPNVAADDLFSMSREASPVDFPVVFPARSENELYPLWGGKSGGVYNNGFRNPVAEYVKGYQSQFSSTLNANLRLEQKLDMITDGLKFNVLASFKNWSNTTIARTAGYNQFEVSNYNSENDEYVLNRVGAEQNTTLNTTGGSTGDRRLFFQAYLDYNRKFGMHDINAMVLYNQDQYDQNAPGDLLSSLPRRKQGIAGRLSYAFDNRYLAEVNFGYNGSENFAKGNRFGFFPSVAVGYNISQEKFWEPLSNVISHLKLRASYGLVGNDGIGERYAYLEDIVLNSEAWQYTTGVNQNITLWGPMWNRFYNPNLTWEVGEKLNIGFDMQLFDDFNLTIDAFREVRSKIFMQKVNTVPTFVGSGVTKIFDNMGKMENVGLDFCIDYNKQITNDFFVSFKGTFTYAHNTILERDEPPFRLYPNLSSVGHSIGVPLIYTSEGLFKDLEELNNHAQQTLGYKPWPGDIKYQDISNVNGECNGIIDGNDRVYMGNPDIPEIVYGFGSSMKYKNWDFSFFFQGVAKTSLLMSGFHPFGNEAVRGVMKFIVDDYWSESNPNPNAAYPRLTRVTNANNEAASSFWLRNGAFLKLKNAEVGYSFKMFRAYLSGANLLTFSPFKYWDPEMGGGSGMKYPTQRVFNFGIQFTFK